MTRRVLVIAAVLLTVLTTVPATAQWQIKTGEDTSVKFGLLLQGWADWAQDPATGGYAQNLFVRRVRFLVGGNVTKNVSFFFETDNANLGKQVGSTKTIGSGLVVQDAFLSVKLHDAFILDGGLILVPLCRNCLTSAAALLPVDYGAFTFVENNATASVAGRDTGFQARGSFINNHLEYRIGEFQGFRQPGGRNSYRTIGRVQYNVCDTENAFFYPSTYFGKKKIIAFGGGFDTQASYYAYSADALVDWPIPVGAVTGEADFIRWDGEKTFTSIPGQNTIAAQAGVFVASAKLMPFFRYEHVSYTATGTTSVNQSRWNGGLAYYHKGNNATVKLGYTRVEPKTGPASNQFTVQLQAFYY